MLTVRELTARSAHERLDGISFKVEQGEVLAVLGSSDSGKHLLGRVISGTHPIMSGEVLINRYRLQNGSDKARIQLGYLANPAATEDFLTGYELLDLVGSIYHLAPSVRAERVQELIDQLEIGPGVYSVLETAPADVRQKVALALAVIHDPKLVILDEPTQLMDFHGPQLLGKLIGLLTDNSTAVVIITDQPELTERLADRYLILDAGRKLLEGTLAQLLNQVKPQIRTLRGVLETLTE